MIDALDFIEKVKTREWTSVPLGRTVAVIGAGNTAVDAVTQAKRLGAEKVIMVYRRTEKDAPAYDYEMELARKDGIEFVWQAAPIGILSDEDNKRVAALQCEKTDGSLQLFDIPCDMVIKAVGQQKMRSFFEKVRVLKRTKKAVSLSTKTCRRPIPPSSPGATAQTAGREAVDASQMGKLAATGHSSFAHWRGC